MAEELGGELIYSTLANTAAVTAVVGLNSAGTGPAIFNARMVPQGTTALNTINFYRVENYNPNIGYFDIAWSIDCRDNSDYNSFKIALAVFDTLNRVNETIGGYEYFTVCEILNTIPPINEEDVYNSPVQCRLKRR